LSNGKVMDTRKLLHLDQGHVVTSHSSQGRTVDQVLVSVPISTFNLVKHGPILCLAFARSGNSAGVYRIRAALREAVAENLSERFSPGTDWRSETSEQKTAPAKAEKKAKQLEQATKLSRTGFTGEAVQGRSLAASKRFTGQD